MSHTPGPWEILPNGVCVIGPCGATDALVAMCGAQRRGDDECRANAQLVVAAPALLEAARRAHGAMHMRLEGMELSGQLMEDIERDLLAAIDLSEGKTP